MLLSRDRKQVYILKLIFHQLEVERRVDVRRPLPKRLLLLIFSRRQPEK
jgi:hypothetical protein